MKNAFSSLWVWIWETPAWGSPSKKFDCSGRLHLGAEILLKRSHESISDQDATIINLEMLMAISAINAQSGPLRFFLKDVDGDGCPPSKLWLLITARIGSCGSGTKNRSTSLTGFLASQDSGAYHRGGSAMREGGHATWTSLFPVPRRIWCKR